MNREELGKKMMENLAIQGQIEDAKAILAECTDGKNDADKVVEAGRDAKVLSDKLAVGIKEAKSNLDVLENELVKSDDELSRNKVKIPRLIQEQNPPTHIKL